MIIRESSARIASYQIYRRLWLPAVEPRARVLLVHGLAEHIGRYDRVAEFLTQCGYVVHGFDLPGHGRSSGRRVYVRRFGELTSVLDACVRWTNQQPPTLPLFVYAHSVGALVAVTWLLSASRPPHSVVLTGPCIRIPDHVSPPTRALAVMLSWLLPWAGVSAVDAHGVSRDPIEVRRYVEDPLVVHGKTTARLAGELMTAIRRLTDAVHRITVPCLILHGGSDPIVDPDSARWLHRALGSTDKQLAIFEDLYHEIHHEPERMA
ncbi:MAG TPA: alpha/beta hydrolase, partial [Candidatus Acetothermia bacterium]|nr:alpha/beta hydrolase [Candidatus Acetothermia bacterium]